MEFRIAPLIIAIFNLLFIAYMNPDINTSISLKTASSYGTVLLPFGLLLALSFGTFFRHTFYSTKFKIAFYILNATNILLCAWYIFAIQQQHI
ncbi:MAG TPA: hypothetical protein PLU10_00980 [Chitinophagaceae bacterium]|nr:hypothetical protein [Chitinophagaceae bacterium]